MVDIFKEVRERLNMEDVARHYGHEPNRAGFLCCPFHRGDRTASLKLYPGGRGWHCFGCNRGGSVIDFVALDLGLSPLDAVKRLNTDFALGLPIDRQQTPAERREAEQAAQRRREVADTYRAFEQWRTDTINRLNACFRGAHLLQISSLDRLTKREALALREQATVEYFSDLLSFGTLAEQVAVFRDRKEVEILCNRILPSTPMKSDVA